MYKSRIEYKSTDNSSACSYVVYVLEAGYMQSSGTRSACRGRWLDGTSLTSI